MSESTPPLKVNLGVNYSAREATALIAAAAAYGVAACTTTVMPVALAVTAACLALGGASRIRPAMKQLKFEAQLIGDRRPYLLHSELVKINRDATAAQARWVGYGFQWGAPQCQSVQEFLKTDWKNAYHRSLSRAILQRYVKTHVFECVRHPFLTRTRLRTISRLVATQPGFRWCHALGEEESKFISTKELEGHFAIFGTTGSGKSRFLEIQIAQAILQGYCVIIVDPKGDPDLVKTIQEICRLARRERDFLYFHVAHPDQSVNFNLLANFTPGQPDAVASRIADTLPGQGGEGQVFVDMARGYLRTVCDGLKFMKLKPTLQRLHYYFGNRRLLALDSLKAYLSSSHVGCATEVDKIFSVAKTVEERLEGLRALYMSKDSSSEMEGILGLADLDDGYFQKTGQSANLLLSALTRGKLGERLSPTETPEGITGVWYDSKKVMERNAVLFLGLDALADSGIARSLGSMFLADLTAAAGARYDYESKSSPVALFVDEAAELMCEPFTHLLNKSRGAKFSITLAAQTVSDFVARAKNPAEARRILANVNNLVVLRCSDEETQKFVLQRVLKTRTQSTMKTHAVSASADQLMALNGSTSERLVEEEVDLIPPALFGAMPNGEFFGVFSGGHVIKGRVPVLVKSEGDFRDAN